MCVACIRLFCIGPCQVQPRRRSRAQTQHEGGSRDLYPDHEEGAWARGTLWPRAGDNYSGKNLSPPPSPPIRALRTEHPHTPFQRAPSTPSTSTTGRKTRRKHSSASVTRSEAMGWARGGWEDHWELFSCFLGGQTAELVTSAGWPARFSLRNRSASLWETGRPVPQDRWRAGRYRTGIYIRNPLVPSYHSATALGGIYTSRHQG